MASTIGRAGKQLFTAIDGSRPDGPAPLLAASALAAGAGPAAGSTSPRPPSLQPPTHLIAAAASAATIRKYGSAQQLLDLQSSSAAIKSYQQKQQRRRDDGEEDLKVALQACASLDADDEVEYLQKQHQLQLQQQQQQALNISVPRGVESPTKPSAISPRIDKALSLNPQSRGAFNEFKSGNTTVNQLLLRSSKDQQHDKRAEEMTDSASAEDFLQSLQKTLQNKRSFNKDELLAQLEALKHQNLMLTVHMERKDQESKERLEQERIDREKAVNSLEQANQELLQQLMDAKTSAEKKLSQEKRNFEDSMNRLEEDKNKLQKQINEKQQQMQFESQIMKQLRDEMQKRIKLLEDDRQRMTDEMSILDTSNDVSNGTALSQENHQRLLMLKSEIDKMDREKSSLIQQLEESHAKAENANKQLLEQLRVDRELFQGQLHNMEKEKRDLCDRLLAAENVAKIQHQVMNEEIDKQKRRSFKLEKKTSHPTEINGKSLKKVVSFLEQPDLEVGFGVVQTPDDSDEEEDDVLPAVNTANMSLQERLKASAAQSKKRVQDLTAKLKKKNKDRLRKNVKKMKDVIISEIPDNHATETRHNGLQRTLPSTKSLFDLVSSNSGSRHNSAKQNYKNGEAYQILGNESTFNALDSIADVLSPLTKPNIRNNGIDTSKEIDEYRIDSVYGSAQESEAPSSTSPISAPELPPPHLSAAKGDIPRLILLGNMDTKLVVSAVDSVNRNPLFYSVAHGHKAATEYILSIICQDPTLHFNINNHFHDKIGQTVNPVHAAAMIFDSISESGADRSQINEKIDMTIYHVIYSSAIYNAICHMDVYGDTVIHAAAAAGSEKIMSMIFKTISDFIKTTIGTIYQEFVDKCINNDTEIPTNNPPPINSFLGEDEDTNNNSSQYENTEKIYSTILTFIVNAQNSLGLSAAHLSQNSEILEVLHNNHANLLSTDYQQRSVLFIACAMNKDSCVEYLISSLDNLPEVLMSNCLLADEEFVSEQYTDNTEMVIMEQIMKRDFRGDTPLHAAACNNSVESLLILLQSGIDPRLLNDKQYTAYDLSIKNNHQKCAQILAEYTLHYCTSSEFDSVLFLKTLEGHKKIHDYVKDNPGYHNQKGGKGAAHNKSMFSLKNAQTMKLQRYGNWIAYYDADNPFAIFWYNHETTQAQWETPLEVMEWQERHHSSSSVNIFDQTMKGKMSMRLQRQGDWIMYTAEEGKTFYYNDKTGDFQWSSPFSNDVEDNLHGYDRFIKSGNQNQAATSSKFAEYRNDVVNYHAAEHHHLPEYVLATEWRPYLDDNSGLVYWYNFSTKESQWESPFEHSSYDNYDANQGGEEEPKSRVVIPDKIVQANSATTKETSVHRQPLQTPKTPVENVFSLDDDDDEDESHDFHDHKVESNRRSNIKEQLKQFSFKRKTSKRDDYEESVVKVNNEHDLDI